MGAQAVTDFAHPDMIAHNRARAAREEQAWATFGGMLSAMMKSHRHAAHRDAKKMFSFTSNILRSLAEGVSPAVFYPTTHAYCGRACALAIKLADPSAPLTADLKRAWEFFDSRAGKS